MRAFEIFSPSNLAQDTLAKERGGRRGKEDWDEEGGAEKGCCSYFNGSNAWLEKKEEKEQIRGETEVKGRVKGPNENDMRDVRGRAVVLLLIT